MKFAVSFTFSGLTFSKFLITDKTLSLTSSLSRKVCALKNLTDCKVAERDTEALKEARQRGRRTDAKRFILSSKFQECVVTMIKRTAEKKNLKT
jgi:hypothetical protein